MFDTLSTRLQGIFDRLGSRGRLTEENIQEALREVRVALLEADVNFKVVRAFIDAHPGQGRRPGRSEVADPGPAGGQGRPRRDGRSCSAGAGTAWPWRSTRPTVVMLMGLQGSGKTTTAAKLARMYAKQGQHPILAAADTYRPAAQDQLRTLGAQLGVPVVGEAGQHAARDLSRGPRRSRGARPDTAHPRHRRPPAHRRADAGGAAEDQGRGRAAPRAPRRGRHDRPGRRHGRRALQRRRWGSTASS